MSHHPHRQHADLAASARARYTELAARCEALLAQRAPLQLEALRLSKLAVRMQRPDALVDVPHMEPPPPLPADATPEQILARCAELELLEHGYARVLAQARARLAEASRRLEQASAAQQRTLGPPPRPVPLTYVLAEFGMGYWVQLRWLLFPPIGLGLGFLWVGMVSLLEGARLVGPSGAVSTAVAIGALGLLVPLSTTPYAVLRAARRLSLLANGEVVRVISHTSELTWGTSRNWPVLVASGWQVRTQTLTGWWRRFIFDVVTSRGKYGRVAFRAMVFDGVIIADPDAPDGGLPNHAFGSWPRPDELGGWDPRLPAGVWLRTLCGLGLMLAFLGAGLLIATGAVAIPGQPT